MKVIKFGGTSVGSSSTIKKVLDIFKDYHSQKEEIVVVVSAIGGMTNLLISMAEQAAAGDEAYLEKIKKFEEIHYQLVRDLVTVQEQSHVFAEVRKNINDLEDQLHGVYLIREASNRVMDFVVSHGERLSAFIIAEAAKEAGIAAEYVDARQLVKTNSRYGAAKINFEQTNKRITEHFSNCKGLQVVTGFIASNADGVTTTLGRGGSDYTAAVLAAALNADETVIWTDVDGVMTADPRIVRNAFSLSAISYSEAMELSHFGAKVIYPPTLQPVFTKRIPVRIRNTFNTDFEGTVIGEESGPPHPMRVKGISSINEVSLINVQGSGMIGVPGVSARLFGALARNDINLILITQASSEHSICFAVAPEDGIRAKDIIEEEFQLEIQARRIDPVKVERDLSVVAIIGENMSDTPGISGKMFSALGRNGVNISAIAQGSSELNISAVIDRKNISKAINALHDAYFLSESRTVNIFMVGPGLIGSTLLQQINDQCEYLERTRSLAIRVVGIANSKKMIFDEQGINLDKWKEALDNSETSTSFDAFTEKMVGLNLPNSVFVDNTSNKEITEYYQQVLENNISIVTPNKVANSGPYERFGALKYAAHKHNVKFLYETNVGAGLPVINTLQDLINSGDGILKIEGVLSGSLSYIFNTYDGTLSFREVVESAQKNGFTEPDPRDDLNGMDVARKILILAREAGFAFEPEDVEIENILPQSCIDAPDVESFFEELGKNDETFKEMVIQAKSEDKKLCFIATLEKEGKITVGLKSIDAHHPFNGLSGSDNMISYTTMRYRENPLVIKGPGAGAEVTAAGVFADIIRISNYLA